jgi:hypothetical protein
MMHCADRRRLVAVDTISVATLAREVGLSPGELHFQMPLIAGHGYTPSRRRPTRRWSHAGSGRWTRCSAMAACDSSASAGNRTVRR